MSHDRILIKGNEAVAFGALDAGCRCYFGYPITPQNEIPETMSLRLPECGGQFVQAESEVAAINMLLGAGACGIPAMTSSSSCGISLMQEGISYMAGSLPARRSGAGHHPAFAGRLFPSLQGRRSRRPPQPGAGPLHRAGMLRHDVPRLRSGLQVRQPGHAAG